MKRMGDQGGNADEPGDDRIPHEVPSRNGESISLELQKFPWEAAWLTGKSPKI